MEHTRVDESSFDHLARLAATGTARRTLLRAGVAAVVAGLGAAVGFSGPAAVVRGKGRGHGGHEAKKKVCVCTSDSCRTQKKPTDTVKTILKNNDCAYRGGCQPGVNPCASSGGTTGTGTGTGTATGTGNGSGTGTGTGSGNGSANGSGNGSGCGSTLSAPFTIEACWTADADHDTYLFLPKESASSADNPFIYYSCGGPGCDTAYPFACIAPDIRTTGCEVTTIHHSWTARTSTTSSWTRNPGRGGHRQAARRG